jgi:hypothetical protein
VNSTASAHLEEISGGLRESLDEKRLIAVIEIVT